MFSISFGFEDKIFNFAPVPEKVMFYSKILIPTRLIKPLQENIYFFLVADATFPLKAVSTPLKAKNLLFQLSNISKSL